MITDLMIVLAAHQGAANAISADDLLATMRRRGHKLPHIKQLRDLIHDARQAGQVIASCAAGYFIPRDLIEATQYVDHQLTIPATDMLRTRRIQMRRIREMFGQGQQLPMM